MKEGRPYVYWQTRFFSGHGLRACPYLSAVRGTVSRQLQGQEFLLSRSVSLHGVCPAHLPGKSARYRNMPSIPTAEAVPYGYPRQGVALNDHRCQRTERLAHLCRSGACTDSYSPQAVQQRAVYRRAGTDRLCPRCDDDRFVSLRVSLGTLPENEKRDQAAYAPGPPRQHPDVHSHLRRKIPRGQLPRHDSPGNPALST